MVLIKKTKHIHDNDPMFLYFIASILVHPFGPVLAPAVSVLTSNGFQVG